MRKISIYLIISTLSVFMLNAACVPFDGIKGNGKVEKEERSVEDFKGIRVGGAFDIYLRQDSETKLMIEADENILPIIRTEVKNGILVISTDEGIRNATELNIYLSCKTLENIDVSGAAEITGETAFTMDELYIDASGASDIELQIKTSMLVLDLSGATEVELSGKASNAKMDISGAAELEAGDLQIAACNIDASGSASADLKVSEKLEVEASGASNVDYRGDPLLMVKESGAADVDKK